MSFRDYVEAGWAIVGFAPGTKGPEGPAAVGWNNRERAITDPQRVNGMLQGGLLHAYSATCSIDIDNMAEARPFLAQHGIDLDALLNARNAVQIVSGRPNRAKLLYRLDKPLVSKKLARYEVVNLLDGTSKKYHALELRCATRNGRSVQDVLPPSIHPGTGKPYEWRYGSELTGSWRNLPPLPETLLALWQEGHAEPIEDLVGGLNLVEEPTAAEFSMAELRFYLEHHTSDAYDDWVAVGMALHDATGGSPEGLLLWDEWSRKFASYGEAKGGLPPQYPTDKWPSFTAGRNGNYTIGYLKSKAPPYVPLDSFPVTPEADAEFKAAAPGEPDRGVDTRPLAVIRRALEPLVFVTSQGTYYDRTRGVLVNRDSIDDMYTPAMPVLHIAGNNGAVKTHIPKPRDELRRASWKEIVDGIGMHPGAGTFFNENGRRYLNTYEAPAIEAVPPTAAEQEAFDFMWSRPSEAIFRDWLLQFYAHAVQKPGVKIRMAPLLVGHTTGSGKSTLMRVLPELLFTKRYVATLTSDSLKEQFNDQLARAWWVHFEEMHSGNARAERVSVFNKVKPWVSEDTISIRPMYGARYDAPNRTQLTGASNYEDDALNVDDQDRRWAVGHIERSMSANEARDLYAFLESPRAPGVLHRIFRNVSLTGFNPNGRAPDTAAKRVMVRVNYGHWESEILELIAAGARPFDKDLLEIHEMLPFVKQGGITVARLQRIVSRPPFNFVKLGNGYGKPLWAWRNAEMWEAVGGQARNDYYTGGPRPAGWDASDALPPALAEACGLA